MKNKNIKENNKVDLSHFKDDNFITNVCLSYRHDYGLMGEDERNMLRFECTEWLNAIQNNWNKMKQPDVIKSVCPKCGLEGFVIETNIQYCTKCNYMQGQTVL